MCLTRGWWSSLFTSFLFSVDWCSLMSCVHVWVHVCIHVCMHVQYIYFHRHLLLFLSLPPVFLFMGAFLIFIPFCFVAQRFLTRAIHMSQGLELSFGASWTHHVVYDGLQWPILNFKLSAPFVSMYRWSCASSNHKLLVFNLDINYT